MSEERAEDVMKVLVGYAYPKAEPAGEGRFVRRWVVRCRHNIPDQPVLDGLAQELSAEATGALLEAYGEQAMANSVAGGMPVARIVRLGPLHCVVCIGLPTSDKAVGDDAAIGTWRILRGLDQRFGIDDLEGIPKRFWFALR